MLNFFDNLYKLSSDKPKIELRSVHVPDEKIEPLQETNYEPAKVVIQKHEALRAGPHFDVRLHIGRSNRSVSFATRKGFPELSGSPRLFVRQPNHAGEFSDFEGTIPEGEYGAGRVSLVHSSPAIARSYGNKLDLSITKGPLKGRYTLINQGGKNHWLAIKNKPPQYFWEERPRYAQADKSLLQHPEFIAEHKVDGIHVIGRFDAKRGLALAERTKNVMGELEGKQDHVPHLRDLKVLPKYHGVVIRGELFHPEHPFRTISSVLLSDPPQAVEAQKKIGNLSLAAFDLIRGPYGKSVAGLSYNQKRDFLKQFVADMGNPYVTLPESSYDKAGLYKRVLKSGGEGVVLKHIMTGEPHKLKKSSDFDLRIAGFEPGAGKYAGRGVGAFKLVDKHGNWVGNVGTGLSDVMRQDALAHPEKWLHRIVKVQAHEVTPDGKLREPRFKGFSAESRQADDLSEFRKTANVNLPHSEKKRMINKQPVPTEGLLNGVKVYSVDGHAVRTLFDSDYSQGGNGFRYSWIPKGEIWVEQNIVHEASPDELQDTILHEFTEMQHMAHGESYNKAHGESKHLEDQFRKAQLAKISVDKSDSQVTARGVLDANDEEEGQEEDEAQREKMNRLTQWLGKASSRLMSTLWDGRSL